MLHRSGHKWGFSPTPSPLHLNPPLWYTYWYTNRCTQYKIYRKHTSVHHFSWTLHTGLCGGNLVCINRLNASPEPGSNECIKLRLSVLLCNCGIRARSYCTTCLGAKPLQGGTQGPLLTGWIKGVPWGQGGVRGGIEKGAVGTGCTSFILHCFLYGTKGSHSVIKQSACPDALFPYPPTPGTP